MIFFAASCEMEIRLASISVTPTITAHAGDKIALDVSHEPKDALAPAYVYQSNNRFIATVDKNGTLVCNHVGTCTISIATADGRFTTVTVVTVLPKNNLFHEPTNEFNINKTSVKLKESGRAIVHETANMLIYRYDEDPVQEVMYLFDENQRLVTTVVKLSASDSSGQLADFMLERYELLPNADRHDLQIWRGNHMEVVTKRIGSDYFVVYNHFSGNSTLPNADQSIETFRNINLM